jgi:hypothetical protein
MALTVTETASVTSAVRPGDKKTAMVFARVTFDSSYPTGGEALASSDFSSVGSIAAVIVSTTNVAGVDAVWDSANSKILLYDEDNTSGIAAQAANTSDHSATVVDILVAGRAVA